MMLQCVKPHPVQLLIALDALLQYEGGTYRHIDGMIVIKSKMDNGNINPVFPIYFAAIINFAPYQSDDLQSCTSLLPGAHVRGKDTIGRALHLV